MREIGPHISGLCEAEKIDRDRLETENKSHLGKITGIGLAARRVDRSRARTLLHADGSVVIATQWNAIDTGCETAATHDKELGGRYERLIANATQLTDIRAGHQHQLVLSADRKHRCVELHAKVIAEIIRRL